MHHVGIGAGGRDGEGTANPIIFPLHSEISSSTAALVTTHRNLIIRMIWKYKDVWTKKTLVGLGLGQLLTSTGLTSSELAKKGPFSPLLYLVCLSSFLLVWFYDVYLAGLSVLFLVCYSVSTFCL